MALEIFAYKRYASVAKYRGKRRYVVLPHTYKGVPVTEIREGVFRGTEVEGVLIPTNLQMIGASAFQDCRNLRYIGFYTNAAFPEQFRTPDELDKFLDKKLPALCAMPPGLRTIEANAFRGTLLQNMRFLSDICELGDSAFEDCSALDTVELPHCDTLALGKRVFANSGIRHFRAPRARIDTMPEYSFANCIKLIYVDIHINAVSQRSFYQCRNLTALNLPRHLRSIGSEAFTGCEKLPIAWKSPRKAVPTGRISDKNDTHAEDPAPENEIELRK